MNKKNKPFEAIIENEKICKNILENIAEVLYRSDNEGRITFITPSAIEMFGYESIEEFLGKNILETFYINPDDRQVFLDKIRETKKVIDYPLTLKKKDGSIIHIKTTSYLIYDEEGKQIGVEGIFRDATDQFQIEGALKKAADIVDNIQLGIHIYQLEDMNDDTTLRMVTANPASEKLTGVPVKDVIGKTLDENFPGLREKGIPQMYAEVVRTQVPVEIEDIYYGDDRVISGAFSVKAFPLPDNHVGISFENITNRKKTEEALRKNESELITKNKELEETLKKVKEMHTQLILSEKMASLGQITAGIAHEIKNPLNFIQGNIEPLKRDLKDILTILKKYESVIDEQKIQHTFSEVESLKDETDFPYIVDEINKLIEGITEGTNRTTQIVKSLGSFSRTEEDKFIKTTIHEGIDSTLTLLGSKIRERIIIHKEYGDIPDIECLPSKLNQVFMNVLTNATQAIDEKGEIFIKTSSDRKMVRISIKDTGRGMSKEVQKHLFEPFFTTKEIGKGTGLGLSITYSIVEQHQGNIIVKSEPGNGAEFIISLPVTQEENS